MTWADDIEILQNEYIALLTQYQLTAKYNSFGKLTNAEVLEPLRKQIVEHPCFSGQRFNKIVETSQERQEKTIVQNNKRRKIIL